ncbi:hypothetical protein JCGZ_09790 [Jatropha curcas]|uniref:rRNA N-glycosylase n=1 Tax=Jatropha curcas TaxID=180498 RepID=A0A067KWZ5_JATCU|nr:hypothetical protein JCGZ_09790 [Jatropha curcas]
MKLCIMVAAWFCWSTIIFGSASARERAWPFSSNNNYAADSTPTLTITYIPDEDEQNYAKFITDLRETFGSSGLSHGIPVLRATVAANQKFFVAKVINAGDIEVSVGLNVINAYLVAYKKSVNDVFLNPVQLQLEDYSFYQVNNVNQLKDAMGSLYNEANHKVSMEEIIINSQKWLPLL